MTSYVTPKKNAEFITYISLEATAGGSFVASPTLAAGDFKVSIDGAATANLSTLPTNTPAASGQVKITLSAAEMNGDNIIVTCKDAAGAEWLPVTINIQTSARQIDDLAYPTTSGRSIDVSAGGEVGLDWANVGSPTTTVTLSGTTVKTATDVETDTADIQSRLPAALVSGRIDASVGAMAANVMTAAAAAADLTTELQSGLATAASISALNNLSSTDVATAVWNAATASYGSAGSYGLLIETNLDAASSTLATAANLATVAGYLDTEISAILADTNELQTDWVDGGRLDLIIDAINAKTTNLPSDPADASVIAARFDTLDTNLATVDTVVDSILVDTAEIGAAGAGLTALATQASVNDLPTNAELATALAAADDAVLAQVALVKAKTDSLTFTVAGQVDANIQYVNDVQVTGTGASGDEWGPT
jgi:hypothetical protein